MVNFLVNKFVPNHQNTKDTEVRSAVGRLCGFIGIAANLFLFGMKYILGVLVNSVSIRADAINNLSDACSNIISIISFFLSNKPADKGHPFGHERSETIASLFVGMIVAYIGIEMAMESWDKIMHPETVDFRAVTVLILSVSMAVKLWMYSYNKRLGKTYDSSLLEATALDSISDVLSTGAVLLSSLLSLVLRINLDGYMGMIVSAIILYNAYELIRDVLNSLLGEAPDPDIVSKINRLILDNDAVYGVHDLIIHNYGPNRLFASAHVEVDAAQDIFEVHDHIDNIERQVHKELGVELVLHMDPVKINDPLTDHYKKLVAEAIQALGVSWNFHDFRIVAGPTHVNLVFDLVIPFDEKLNKEEIIEKLRAQMPDDKKLYFVLTIDHPMS